MQIKKLRMTTMMFSTMMISVKLPGYSLSMPVQGLSSCQRISNLSTSTWTAWWIRCSRKRRREKTKNKITQSKLAIMMGGWHHLKTMVKILSRATIRNLKITDSVTYWTKRHQSLLRCPRPKRTIRLSKRLDIISIRRGPMTFPVIEQRLCPNSLRSSSETATETVCLVLCF